MIPRPSLHRAFAETVALLEVAYATHLRACIARNLARRSRVAARALETLLDSIIPDALCEHEGVDGRVVWMLASLSLHRRRRAVEADVLKDERDVIGAFDVERAWRLFRARLTFSTAGLEWGGIVRYVVRKRS